MVALLFTTPDVRTRDLSIVVEMKTICDEFEAYGYRRVDAELRHRGIVVNAKKIRRLMREHALNPRQRRRFIATTDSDHNYPVFPNLAKSRTIVALRGFSHPIATPSDVLCQRPSLWPCWAWKGFGE